MAIFIDNLCERRLSAANAAKLISEWIENDDKDEDNVEFDDSSDVSEKDNKTSIRCHMCSNFVCGTHATKRYLCVDDCRLDDCADS